MNPCSGFGKEKLEPPNVVFIVLDAARADHFSAYGYGKKTTPRMDAIARAGALFLNNFSPASVTQRSIPRIFSSRYFSTQLFSERDGQYGARRENPRTVFLGLDAQQIFLPQALSRLGYHCALFTDHYFLRDKNFFVRLFDEHHHFDCERASEEVIFSRLIAWLKRNETGKFFVYLHIMSPRWTVRSGSNLWPPFDGRRPRRRYEELLGDMSPDMVRSTGMGQAAFEGRGLPPDQLRAYRGVYDNNLRILDDQVGRLYAALNELGLGRKTIMIISADHGENLSGEIVGHGGSPRDSVTKVPLIIVYPPRIRPQTRVQGLTQSIDIMPTILELIGAKLPPQKTMDGMSLLSVIGRPDTGRKAVFLEDAVRTPEYKCIQTRDALTLYDLRTDPEEAVNIAPGLPELAKELCGELRALDRFKKRFLLAARGGPPDFSFSYLMHAFSMSPKAAVKEIDEEVTPTKVLNEATAPWVLNAHERAYSLHRSSWRESAPLTLSAPVPSGSYRVGMRFKCSRRLSLKEFGLRFRFNSDEFLPAREGFADQATEYAYYSYSGLGKTTVTNDVFSVDIELPPLRDADAVQCMLRGVQFEPLDGRGNSADLAAQGNLPVLRRKIIGAGYW